TTTRNTDNHSSLRLLKCPITPPQSNYRVRTASGSERWLLMNLIWEPRSLPLAVLTLVRQRIDNVIDPEFISLVRLINRLEWIVRPLPPIAHIVIVVDDHHQPPGAVFQPKELRRQPTVTAIHRPQLKRLDRKETVED